MSERSEARPTGMLDLTDEHPPTREIAGGGMSGEVPAIARSAEPIPPLVHREDVLDWRTIDPAMIRGEGIPLEELLFYRESLEKLLTDAAGRYVLIVGQEVVSLFDDLVTAANYAARRYEGRAVLIKKIAATEPIHTLGGAVRGSAVAPGGMR